MTPHGLELRLSWGEHVLAEHFLRADRTSSFTVGSAPGCAFAMDDLAGPSFEVARVGPVGIELRFASWMQGEVSDDHGRRSFLELVDAGEAVPDGDGYVVAVAGGAHAELELGALTLRAAVRSCPEPVSVPLAETIDFTSLNIFMVLLALAGSFVVSALNRDLEGEAYADGFAPNGSVVVAKLLVQSAPSGPIVRHPAEHTAAEGAQSREGPSRSPRPAAAPRAQAKSMLGSIFSSRNGALSAILGEGAAGGGELQAAIRGLAGSGATAALDVAGFGGLGVRGLGTGGSPGDPYAIGAIGMKGRPAEIPLRAMGGFRCGGCGGTWTGFGSLGGAPPNSPIVADGSDVTGALDPELVRGVIRSHRDQIRYCYEQELARDSSLSGKLVVKFMIGLEGLVVNSLVVDSTMRNAGVERCVNSRVQSWVFPKPKGGGVVVVRYPFVLTQSGS